MAVKIRLMRVGKKKQPSYRVVVADARSPRDGRIIERIGRYAPRQEPSLVDIDGERALDWLRKGAQPTEQVQKLLQITGVWDSYKTGKPLPERDRPVDLPTRQDAPAAKAPAPKAAAPAPAAPTAPATAPAAEAPAAEAPAAEAPAAEVAAEPEAEVEAAPEVEAEAPAEAEVAPEAGGDEPSGEEASS